VNCWVTELLFTDSVVVLAEKIHLSPHRSSSFSWIITTLSSIVLCPLWLKVNRAHVFVVVPLVDLDETCAMHSC
jgi:hypothetical protein